MIVSYKILSDDEVFINKVHDVLNHPNGWNKYGFVFKNINGGGDALTIELKTEHEMSKDPSYRDIQGLSGYKESNKTVTINDTNWRYGHIKSNMNCCSEFDINKVDSDEYKQYINNPVSLEDYRNYVINHEVGHHLQTLMIQKYGNRDNGNDPYHHRPDPYLTGGVMPVMIQLTKGKNNLQSFQQNYFPLDITEKYNEFHNMIGDIPKKIAGGEPDILPLCALMYSINVDALKITLLIISIVIMVYYLYKNTNVFKFPSCKSTYINSRKNSVPQNVWFL